MSDRSLPARWASLTSDATLRPELTIRPGDSGPGDTLAAQSRPTQSLPSISVDLRDAATPASRLDGAKTDLEVKGLIGEGGMGRVLLARQHSLARDVAVKTARPDAPQATRDALLVEGTITGSLEHPAIVPVHALGLDPSGWPAMVMKRIEGVAWDGLLADDAHPGWEGWEGAPGDRLSGHLQILALVCNALHFAHSRGFVHRDVKPQNVLIGRFGDVYLADWGVAAPLGQGHSQVCGTPAYLAPEMVSGGPVDARTDVYLLGATLHVVLTGQPRHPGATLTESLLHASRSPPFDYAPAVPPELAALANRACHLEPAQRPQTAKAFRDELGQYLRHREARALGVQGINRLAELETLLALERPDDEQRRRIERLLLEARFGLEQSLGQWANNDPARAALDRVEAILEQRQRRAAALEHEERERDPARGVGWRTVGLAAVSALTGGAAVLALLYWNEKASPLVLVVIPAAILALILGDTALLRTRLLGSRFDRQVFSTLVIGLGLMVMGRALGLVVPIAPEVHFARDSFVTAGVAAMAAVTLLRWLWLFAALFTVVGTLCVLFPEVSVVTFSTGAFLGMLLATGASARSWLELRRAGPHR